MILVNGKAQDHIGVADRGLQYGDGLFETIAVRTGLPRLWDRHWRRLASGCRRLGIGGIDSEQLWNEALELNAGVERGVLKLIVTRGEGGRGYLPPRTSSVTRILATYPWPDYPASHWQRGIALRVCATRLARNAALAGMKHLNRLEQVMARREWDDPDIIEGLMLDDDGNVIAGTMSNLFIVSSGRLVTPLLTACGVEGVMRGVILDVADELAIPYEVASLRRKDIEQASEVFLCNALIGIWPVRRVEHQEYSIGPLTGRISERLRVLLRSL